METPVVDTAFIVVPLLPLVAAMVVTVPSVHVRVWSTPLNTVQSAMSFSMAVMFGVGVAPTRVLSLIHI